MADSKKAVNNMTGREIKEQYLKGKLTLQSLTVDELSKLMDYEVNLLSLKRGGDVALVGECFALVNQKSDENPTEADMRRALDYAFSKYETASEQEKKLGRIKKRFGFRRAAILAAAVLLIAAVCVTVVSAALGIDIFGLLKKVASQPAGTEINADEFTFYNGGEAIEYKSVDEFKKQTGYKFVCPSKWPDNVDITQVRLSTNYNGKDELAILTADPNIYIIVELNTDLDISNFQGEDVYKKGEAAFYVFEEEECFAYTVYGGNYYTVQANSTEEIKFIIDNLE